MHKDHRRSIYAKHRWDGVICVTPPVAELISFNTSIVFDSTAVLQCSAVRVRRTISSGALINNLTFVASPTTGTVHDVS